MNIRWRKYVAHERVQQQIKGGWVVDLSDFATHHDKYGISMLWPHPGDPPGLTIDDRHDALLGEHLDIMRELVRPDDGQFQP